MITTILVFGFEKKEIQKIESLFSEFDILDVGCSTDLIALPACAIIISGSSFEKEYLDELVAYYKEVGTYSEEVIFIGEPLYKTSETKKFIVCSDLDELERKAKYLALTIKKKERKRHTFSSTVATAIKVLVEIKNDPGVTTAQLAEKIEISSRSVLRNIETLNMAGESIVKDNTSKGWKLEFDESLLLVQNLPQEDEGFPVIQTDDFFEYREMLREYLEQCGLSDDEAFDLSEKVRMGMFYKKEFSHPLIPTYVTEWFSRVKYLPSVRRLLRDEKE